MFRVLWGRRRFLIALMLTACLLAGGYALGIADPIYKASASVVLESRKNTVVQLGNVVEDLGQDEEIVNSEVEVMRSRSLLLRVVDQLQLTQYPEFNPELSSQNLITLTLAQLKQRLRRDIPDEVIKDRPRARAVDILTRKIKVQAIPSSLVFRVSVKSLDPRLAAIIANTICRLYVRDQLQAKKEASKEAEDWLYQRVLELQQDMLQEEINLKQSNTDRDLLSIRQLERETEASKEIYGHFLNRYKETAARAGLHRPDSRILSAAVEPLKKHSPKTLRIIAFAMVMSLMLGVAWVLLEEMRSTRIRTKRGLEERTNLPVLGLLPLVKCRRAQDWRGYAVSPKFAGYQSAMRRLRQGMMMAAENAQVVAVLAPDGGCKQALFAGALAQSFADLGRRVLLIETDAQAGDIFVEAHATTGVMPLLETGGDPLTAVQSPSDLDFRIMGPGKTDAVPADLLATKTWPAMVQNLRTHFDMIIINAAPILAQPDAGLVTEVADAALMLVRWNHTDTGQLEAGFDGLGAVADRVIGTVLEDVSQKGLHRCGLGNTAEARYVELGRQYSA